MLSFFVIIQSVMLIFFILRWYFLLNELSDEKAKNKKPFTVNFTIDSEAIEVIKSKILSELNNMEIMHDPLPN